MLLYVNHYNLEGFHGCLRAYTHILATFIYKSNLMNIKNEKLAVLSGTATRIFVRNMLQEDHENKLQIVIDDSINLKVLLSK